MGRTRIAMLGCGYVANMYRLTLEGHPDLTLVGVHDRERSRCETMARLTGADAYPDLDALLSDPRPSIVLNLTNPSEHYATTRALLEAGKHVYTEKPLAMRLDQARALAALSQARGLHLVSAPCTLLGPVARTLHRTLAAGTAGRIRLVHAEMEDGMVPRAPVHRWVNEAGMAWPAVDEYATGCTVEHAGYVLSWLCAMFGPVTRLTAHAEELMPDKIPGIALPSAPDLSVAVLRFENGVVARMTNGLYARHDHRLTFYGDEGTVEVADPRSDASAIRLRRYRRLRRRRFLDPVGRRVRLMGGGERIARYRGSQVRDFCRAVADMGQALREGRAPLTGADFAAHIAEVTLACHFATHPSGADAGFEGRLDRMPYAPVTRFAPIAGFAA
ncbi:oxidoreductase, putative [Oceaniovalibus guishaninsula JLT2003]|uniref:Oxidoreductase, putative n=1 Tax=Oceaniovalibus guishaninsula JLT2003 TaxID=1231392 RepID=K2H9G5_9RHOB|nr:Gfo/Idh/MocA family oxidoreductase [Oceaniovalibus guishaninsula]EKE43252.1 oxidoreductase, putative [Oceaniovalibus guishaninsula JLT2003]